MKKILLAIDGSARSAEAIDFEVELASELEVAAIFVHVAPPATSSRSTGSGMARVMPTISRARCPRPRPRLEDAEQIAEQHGVLPS